MLKRTLPALFSIWVAVHAGSYEWTGSLKSLTPKYCRIYVQAFPEAGELGRIEKAFKLEEINAIYFDADSTAVAVRRIVK